MLIGLIKWSCTVQASELPVRASQLIAFDAGHAGLSFLPLSPRMICHPRVRLCGHPQTHKNMLAASSVGLRLAATRPACNLRSDARTDGALVAINPVRIPPPRRRRTHPPSLPPNSTTLSFAAEYVEEEHTSRSRSWQKHRTRDALDTAPAMSVGSWTSGWRRAHHPQLPFPTPGFLQPLEDFLQ